MKCPNCDTEFKRCFSCNGTGKETASIAWKIHFKTDTTTCSECGGRGFVVVREGIKKEEDYEGCHNCGWDDVPESERRDICDKCSVSGFIDPTHNWKPKKKEDDCYIISQHKSMLQKLKCALIMLKDRVE